MTSLKKDGMTTNDRSTESEVFQIKSSANRAKKLNASEKPKPKVHSNKFDDENTRKQVN